MQPPGIGMAHLKAIKQAFRRAGAQLPFDIGYCVFADHVIITRRIGARGTVPAPVSAIGTNFTVRARISVTGCFAQTHSNPLRPRA